MIITLWMTLLSCTVESAEFQAGFPESMCTRIDECIEAGSGFENPGFVFESEELCIADWEEAVLELEDAGCDYNGSQGRQCLAALADSTCDERTAIYYECKKVYTSEDDSIDCQLDVSVGL
jgi:hypothetical protein